VIQELLVRNFGVYELFEGGSRANKFGTAFRDELKAVLPEAP
jgi:hypothetical protein